MNDQNSFLDQTTPNHELLDQSMISVPISTSSDKKARKLFIIPPVYRVSYFMYCDYCEKNVYVREVPFMYPCFAVALLVIVLMSMEITPPIHELLRNVWYRLLFVLLHAGLNCLYWIPYRYAIPYRCKECDQWVCRYKEKVHRKDDNHNSSKKRDVHGSDDGDGDELVEFEYFDKGELVYCYQCKMNRELYMHRKKTIVCLICIQIAVLLCHFLYFDDNTPLTGIVMCIKSFILMITLVLSIKYVPRLCRACNHVLAVGISPIKLEVDENGEVKDTIWIPPTSRKDDDDDE